jgi:hypothetical protein
VIVQTVAPPSGQEAFSVLEQIWADHEAGRDHGRSAEQIDADLRAMRDEWDKRERELDRARAGME